MKPAIILPLFLRLSFAAEKYDSHITDASQLHASYDYVIAGGGTSGLVVANRLTENVNVTVLVIEVGELDDDSPGTIVPGVRMPDKFRRLYNSTPQAELGYRKTVLATGQVVGGGSVINGMFFNRGSAPDYDAWEELGNDGWGWEGLLPYFKKSENYTPATEQIQDLFPVSSDLGPHGTDGPVGSSHPPFTWGTIPYFWQAWKSLGVAFNPQPNDGLAVGVLHSPLSLTAWNMSRSHASNAYYKATARSRENLHLLTGHRVHKIIFNGKRAKNVEFSSPASPKSILLVKVNREVILAAGAQSSPQILQLSGVGSKDLLQKHKINLIHNLPGVGYNFHDQPAYYLNLTYSNYSHPTPDWLDIDFTHNAEQRSYAEEQLRLYHRDRQGAFTVPYRGGGDAVFLPLRNVTTDHQTIIAEATRLQTSPHLDSAITQGHRLQREILLRHYASPNTATVETKYRGAAVVVFIALKPLSRGTILISSADPYEDPAIDFATFRHPVDLHVMMAAFRRVRESLHTPAMRELGTEERFTRNFTTDEELEGELRRGAVSSWSHPVGTLAMMSRELGGVVDSKLCVYGIGGVRVVDASMMPMGPASHTSSTVYAVAEKAADLIKMTECRAGV